MEILQGFETEENAGQEEKITQMPEKKKPAFAVWTVGGRDHRMKLSTATICQMEEKFKCNLLTLISAGGGIPPLATMLTLIQAGMKQWEHGVSYKDVQEMFDRYCDEGGTQLSLLTDVLMPLYQVSGFFSERQAEAMNGKIEDARELM